jgi:hypothetical protein
MSAYADELRATGICRLGIVPWVGEFNEFMSWKPRMPGHVSSRPRPGIFHSQMKDVMAAPHFLGYAKSFTPLASEYFGSPAHLWSLNAMHTDEKTPYVPGVNGLHRDREADKILALFMFATDVEVTGAQLFMASDDPDNMRMIYGPKGTAWICDPRNFHCGLLPRGPRTLVWARFADVVPAAKAAENLPDVL